MEFHTKAQSSPDLTPTKVADTQWASVDSEDGL